MKNRVILLASCLMFLSASAAMAQGGKQTGPSKPNGPVGSKDVPNKPPPTIKLFPDLVIEEVQVVNPDIGKIVVRVRNKGNKPSAACQTYLSLPMKNGGTESYSQMTQPALGINAFIWLTIQTGYSVVGRDFWVKTDEFDKVKELNETNNTWRGNMGGKP
ncbi:MAG: hypothetical protein H0U54_15010 [Acidobacteria bacterium]|nr:hypothetical protein [Acidobacteriota bacterium]